MADVVAPRGAVDEPTGGQVAVRLAQALRREGVDVPTGATLGFAASLGVVQADRPSELYWAGRATLIRRPEDVPAFDRAFARFLGASGGDGAGGATRRIEVRLDVPDDDAEEAHGGGDDPERPASDVVTVRWSPVEVLRHQDLASCSPDELDEAHRLMADLRVHAALRRSRRRRPAPRGRGPIDVRGTVRRALRAGGEVVRPVASVRGDRPRRLVLLLDVSGSMEPYARALARFAHAAVAARRRGGVEVFALGTRVTRISRELATHDPDEALRRAAASVADWAGGTRLGDGLRWFNDRWGVRGIARGSVVVILSDGWDRGDPEVLATELARLRRVAHRLVWVNPLKASPGYAPLARGMAAALPHVDEFVEGHSVASLESLANVVAAS